MILKGLVKKLKKVKLRGIKEVFKAYSLAVGLVSIAMVSSAVINLNYPNYKPTASVVKIMRGY